LIALPPIGVYGSKTQKPEQPDWPESFFGGVLHQKPFQAFELDTGLARPMVVFDPAQASFPDICS
jgi:hypothetical protein